MRILVLVKPVPIVGTERMSADDRTVRDQLELNGNDEYVLERALRLGEAHGAEVAILAMAPPAGTDALRKALAMGAGAATLVSDPAITGSDIRSTVRVLAAAVERIGADLVMVGAGSSDGSGAVVSGALAARLGLPYLGDASDVQLIPGAGLGSVRVRRPLTRGAEVVQVALPALVMGTQLLGEPRYPSLRGIMAARSRSIETWSLADLGIAAESVGAAASGTRVADVSTPPERGTARVVTGTPDEAATTIMDFLAGRGLL